MIELGRKLIAAYAWFATTVILGLVYFLALAPACALARLAGWDPLDLGETRRDSYWTDRSGDDAGCSERIY